MKKIKIAVIGTGLVGTFHAETFYRNPYTDLIAVCDTDQQKSKSVADRFNCKAYNEFSNLLNTESLEAIKVGTIIQKRDGISRYPKRCGVDTLSAIHSIVVVTSPIGEKAPPALAAIIISPANHIRISLSFTNFCNNEINTINELLQM